jgi:acyl carrier protein
MDETAIMAGVTEIFRDVFDDPGLVPTAATTADDVPGWDSMTHITLVVGTEQRFGVKFKTAEIEALNNVGELVRLIAAKLARPAGAPG